jgi:hypothetical protein
MQHWNAFGPGANENLNAMNVAAAAWRSGTAIWAYRLTPALAQRREQRRLSRRFLE